MKIWQIGLVVVLVVCLVLLSACGLFGKSKAEKERELPFDLKDYYKHDNELEKARIRDSFYNSDRAMRESGFDVSDRFGPFSADIPNYNPVCFDQIINVGFFNTLA